jgi:hypothetical protein
VLRVSLHDIGSDASLAGGFALSDLEVTGREQATRVLKNINPDLKRSLVIATEVLTGREVYLLGTLALPATQENDGDCIVPLLVYMIFDLEGKVRRLVIAAQDLRSQVEEIITRMRAFTATREPLPS